MASTARPIIPERPLIGRLRKKLRAAEAASGLGDGAFPLALGIPVIDAALGGGLASGALHEIAAAREAEVSAATGFVLALAACRSAAHSLSSFRTPPPGPALRAVQAQAPARARNPNLTTVVRDPASRAHAHDRNDGRAAIVWIAEDLALAESGAPYGPGLDQTGLAPERLITVAAARGRDVLWAMEEALRCRTVGMVIGELRARDIDQVAMRRLSLAAAAGNTLGLFLRPAPDDAPSAAATRWLIGAAPSLLPSPERGRWGIGPPRLAARLMRNRRGHLGTWIVEWDSVEQRFVLATHSEPVVRPPVDRPHQAAVA